MTWFFTLPIAERILPFLLFALYVVTAVKLCRYSSWRQLGAPNPFLPRKMKHMLRKRALTQMSKGEFPQAFA